MFQAGSLGKGTSVRDSADIDLVVYVNGLNSIRQLSRKKRLLLEALKERAARYPDWSEEIEEDKTTRFSVSFSHGEHEVDILPASDVLKREVFDSVVNFFSLEMFYHELAFWTFPSGHSDCPLIHEYSTNPLLCATTASTRALLSICVLD